MRQIYRYLRQEKTYSQCTISLHSSREVVVLMDAMYWGRNFGVVIFQDNTDGIVLWYKFIDKKESVGDYEEGLKHLLRHGIKINGIVSDGLIGLREDDRLSFPVLSVSPIAHYTQVSDQESKDRGSKKVACIDKANLLYGQGVLYRGI
jgi:hypothetical protein